MVNKSVIGGAVYLGGVEGHTGKRTGTLTVSETGVKIGPLGFEIPASQVKAIEITDGGDDAGRITATRAALIGPFALAFRKKRKQCFIVVTLDNGQESIYRIEKDHMTVRAKIAPGLRALHIPA